MALLTYSKFLPLALQQSPQNVLKVTADLTSATWNTVASHRLFTVTGTARLIVIPKIRIAAVGASGTYALGVTGSTSAWIGATAVAAMLIGTLWLSTTPATTFAMSSLLDRIVADVNVGYAIATTAASAGAIDVYCYWEPLVPGASVVAGTGGAL